MKVRDIIKLLEWDRGNGISLVLPDGEVRRSTVQEKFGQAIKGE